MILQLWPALKQIRSKWLFVLAFVFIRTNKKNIPEIILTRIEFYYRKIY